MGALSQVCGPWPSPAVGRSSLSEVACQEQVLIVFQSRLHFFSRALSLSIPRSGSGPLTCSSGHFLAALDTDVSGVPGGGLGVRREVWEARLRVGRQLAWHPSPSGCFVHRTCTDSLLRCDSHTMEFLHRKCVLLWFECIYRPMQPSAWSVPEHFSRKHKTPEQPPGGRQRLRT